jgi:hypothetical protein
MPRNGYVGASALRFKMMLAEFSARGKRMPMRVKGLFLQEKLTALRMVRDNIMAQPAHC